MEGARVQQDLPEEVNHLNQYLDEDNSLLGVNALWGGKEGGTKPSKREDSICNYLCLEKIK